ncbi:thiamine pyrophosphate-requiring enzyme [Clostridium sp. CAG:253]|nr:thiamine pyrophosphate-requiring enzyme [Clostridium sp. CAG:253]
MKRVADIIVETLIDKGIDTCFSVVGGGAMHLNNAFYSMKDKIKTIYNHHEQACAMAAEGYARLTGEIAAVCVTSGPGGTNTINGVQGAWVESLPMIVISGHPRLETTVGVTGLDIRIRGVQENNIIEQIKPITKYAIQIKDANEAKYEVEKAIHIAMTGRRGPVWIDVPLDIQGSKVAEDELRYFEEKETRIFNLDSDIEALIKKLNESERPCILTGSGIRSGNAISGYKKFCENIKIPIIGGALRADINYNGEKLYYGLSGMIGPRCGNFILQKSDLILVLGNSLSTNQTGFNVEKFAKNAEIIMVDAQKDEAKKPGLHVNLLINASLRDFFDKFNNKNIKYSASEKWINYCEYVYRNLSKYEILENDTDIKSTDRVPALLFWKEFLESIDNDEIIVLGNSSCVQGALQYGISTSEQRILANVNCGSMGYDLPAAIGAAVSGKKIYCVTGDGSVMMNLQELQTIVYNNMNIKIVIFNNDGYGAIRTTCKNYFNGAKSGCDETCGVSFPDFEKIANAFEMDYFCVKSVEHLQSGIKWIKEMKKACILEIYELIDDIKGPKIMSKMDDEGKFYTPGLQDMDPPIDKKLYEELMGDSLL